MTKFKGVRIVKVNVPKYEVRDPTGRVMHKASTPTAARSWVNGYLSASAQALKQVEVAPVEKPKRARKTKTLDSQ